MSRPIYSPSTLKAWNEKKADITRRFESGELTTEEAQLEFKRSTHAMLAAAKARAGDKPVVKVACPDCGVAQKMIGSVNRWRCGCSPAIERVVALTRLEL